MGQVNSGFGGKFGKVKEGFDVILMLIVPPQIARSALKHETTHLKPSKRFSCQTNVVNSNSMLDCVYLL